MYKRENIHRQGHIYLRQERMGGGLSAYPRRAGGEVYQDEGEEDNTADDGFSSAQRKQNRQAQLKQQLEDEESGNKPSLSQKGVPPKPVNSPGVDDDEDPDVGDVVFYLLLAVGIILDATAVLINFFFPGVGGLVTTILITLPGGAFFLFVFYKLGLKFTPARKNKIIWPFLAEFFPIINALPGFIVSVIINLRGKKIMKWIQNKIAQQPK